MPLYGRANVSKQHPSFFNDAKAVEVVESLDYDFSILHKSVVDYFWYIYAARAVQFDKKVKVFIKEHTYASVINLGAGLDTAFYRVDNGTIRWYDIDLPELIEVRRQVIPETERATCIAKSFLDPTWCQNIDTRDGVFIVAGGLFHYYVEGEIRQFFSLLADHIPGCEIVFEAESKSSAEVDGNYGAYGAGWSDDEPEKRNAIQAETIRALKNLWMVAPLFMREKLIGALTVMTKPKSAAWDDFEHWWNLLSATEKGKVMSDLVAGSHMTGKSPLENANEIMAWDAHVSVVDQFPLFRGIPRDPSMSLSVRQFMKYTDEKERIKIFHLRI
jgi:O-methyltransferase involved in polyketide biosynthesis